jgi:hypothetical protein
MTVGEFAEAHGLSLEEAEFVLSRRRVLADTEKAGGRLGQAKGILAATQKRVGVHPVSVEGDEVRVIRDPDADVGVSEFYAEQEGVVFDPPLRTTDDWEEPV